jgi:hypothetical protein
MYPIRCLRIPPGVRVPQVEYHWFTVFCSLNLADCPILQVTFQYT